MERRRDWLKYLLNPRYLEHRKLEGWSGFLPFYICFCRVHGYYEDYPHGYTEYFSCPKCQEESK